MSEDGWLYKQLGKCGKCGSTTRLEYREVEKIVKGINALTGVFVCGKCGNECRPTVNEKRYAKVIAAYKTGKSMSEIAREFSVSRQRVSQIIRGKFGESLDVENRQARATKLPERAVDILAFIIAYKIDNDGNSPSMREIGNAVGVKSSSLISYYLDSLERAGKIRRGRNNARHIELVGGKYMVGAQ